MRIVKYFSHLNGLEYLLVHKKQLWDEVCEVISLINAEEYRTKISKEKTMKGKKEFHTG